MKLSKSTFILAASVVISLAAFIIGSKRVNIFHCTSHVDSLHNSNSSLHTNFQVFIYNDHTGFITHKGKLISKDIAYTVDRQINFELYDDNKDGVMTFVSKGVIKTPLDKVPDGDLWNRAYAAGVKYFPTILRTVSGDTMIIEGGRPNYACSQKNE